MGLQQNGKAVLAMPSFPLQIAQTYKVGGIFKETYRFQMYEEEQCIHDHS